LRKQQRGPLHPRQHGSYFIDSQHHRESRPALDSLQFLQFADFHAQDIPVKEENRTQGLRLRRRSHPSMHSQVVQKGRNPTQPDITWMQPAMEKM
jgi:hypothetical protein